jgi:signal peptidase
MVDEKKPQKKSNKILRIVTWAIGGFIALVIAGLLLIHFLPGYGLYFVRTGSMVPTINVGDIVVTGPPENITAGTIITFLNDNITVTHRVIAVKGDMLQTMGDANEDPDSRLTPVSNVLGKYMFRIPKLGYINGFVTNRKGWFLVIIIPTIILVGFIVKDILKETFKKETKKTEGGDVKAVTKK